MRTLKQSAFLLAATIAALVFAQPVFAGASSGLDTAPGVNNLPLSVQGTPFLTLQGAAAATGTSPATIASSLFSVPVGIGTLAPAAQLDVEGAGGVVLNAGNVGIGTTTPAGALDIEGTAGVVLNAGHVGIGTSSPLATMDVTGAIKVGSDQTVFDATTGCDAAHAGEQRYNPPNQVMEYCNGTNWVSLKAQSQAPTSTVCGPTTAGIIRFNTATNTFEGCNGTKWVPLGGSPTGTVLWGGTAIGVPSSCPSGYTSLLVYIATDNAQMANTNSAKYLCIAD